MSESRDLTAQDFLPLVRKLPHDEQVRLAKLALLEAARAGSADAETYLRTPPRAEEFATDEDPLAWEAEGWDALDVPR